jgi:hypothetical protein
LQPFRTTCQVDVDGRGIGDGGGRGGECRRDRVGIEGKGEGTGEGTGDEMCLGIFLITE